MKVDNSIKPIAAPASSRIKPQGAVGGAKETSASDEVKLSALAGALQSGDTRPPVDSARVAEIKQAIADGRFTINTGAIADRLIDTARDLINSQRKA